MDITRKRKRKRNSSERKEKENNKNGFDMGKKDTWWNSYDSFMWTDYSTIGTKIIHSTRVEILEILDLTSTREPHYVAG